MPAVALVGVTSERMWRRKEGTLLPRMTTKIGGMNWDDVIVLYIPSIVQRHRDAKQTEGPGPAHYVRLYLVQLVTKSRLTTGCEEQLGSH